MPKTNNKSKRVRDYLTSKPDAPNSEVMEALGKYGVKYHDITNVRASMRKKEALGTTGQTATSRRGRPPKSDTPAGPGFAKAYEAGLKLVSDAGGIDEALQVLQVIRMIANSKLA